MIARAVQGAGAAVVTPLTLTLIAGAFPAEKRGAAIGIWGGIAGLAVAAGPLVGGAVVAGLDWHWIFWINVPVAAVVIPLARRHLDESYGPNRRLDVTGLALCASGSFALTWALIRGNAVGWASAEVFTAFAAAVVLIGAFITWERRTAQPMLPMTMFRNRAFASASAVSFFMYGGLFGALFLMSQLLQNALGYGPLAAGVRLLPWTVTPMLIAPVAGALADRVGNRRFMVAGLALQAIGYAWVASIAATDVSYLELGLAFTVAGTGTSLCFPTVANAVMASVPPDQAGVASGTNSALRELGGVVGVAVLAAVFARHGGYVSPGEFIAGFKDALWVAVALSALGITAALAAPRPVRSPVDGLHRIPGPWPPRDEPQPSLPSAS